MPSTFTKRVYALLRQVPAGRVTTYKALAEALDSKAYQAIGQLMHHNPDAPRTPCHRVVASDGRIGGFVGENQGPRITEKIQMLAAEGVTVHNGKVENFEQVLFTDFSL